jgi:hypothetical protein
MNSDLLTPDVIGTTPAGGQVVEPTESPRCIQRPLRWQKMVAYLVASALLTGVVIFALSKAPDNAGLLYGTFAGSLVSSLLSYTAGNVAEHRVLSGLTGIFSAKK